jgi:hypothetical protein
VVLDAAGDGVREMAAFRAGRHDIAAVYLVSHGSAGELSLALAGALTVFELVAELCVLSLQGFHLPL